MAILALVVVALIVLAGVVPRMKARETLDKETRELALPTVSVIHPTRGAPRQEIALPGKVEAFIDSPIYARTNGYLRKWYVDIGAHVKTGQLLAEIDTPEVDQELLQARADLNTARANLRLAQITAARYQGLLGSDSVAKQDVDNAVGDFQAKQAMVASAQANVNRLEQMQSFNKIYAPFSGVITARNTDIGALIDSGSSGGTASELFHLAATKTLRVYINVPQIYSQSARPGIVADLTLPEYPGRRFSGKLVRTSNSIDLATRTLLVEVDVENPTAELLPGAYATVHLKIPSGTPTYILPVNTLIFRAQGLQVAKVENGNRAVLSDITIRRDMGNAVEVASGIADSDSIIANPPDSIVSGEAVQVVAAGSNGTE
ncbi:MAG: efflux RND transporter periplasmic adaptor subunit [Candidatus Acidiferrales bacterium]